jgi:hypothetical protein
LYKENELICSGRGDTEENAEQDSSKNALIICNVIN